MQLERNLFQILERSAHASWKHQTAFTFTDGSELTFVELRDRALALAQALVARGFQKGDRVALLMNNRKEWVEAYFGLAAAGIISVPVNIMLVPVEIDDALRESGARAIVFDDMVEDRAAQLTAKLDLAIRVRTETNPPSAEGFVGYEDLIAEADPSLKLIGPDLHDPLMIVYTSGTTGKPKGAVHSHNGVLWNAAGQMLSLRLNGSERLAVTSSLSWVAGMHVLTVAMVWVGGVSHIRALGGATGESVVDMLIEQRTTHIFMPPAILSTIAHEPKLLERLEGSNLRWVLTGGAPVPRTLLEIFTENVPSVALCQGMGLSEFPPVIVVLDAEHALDHVGSAGKPMPASQVAVRTSEGEIAASGSGELLVRSLATMTGYWNQPEATAEAFRDGWLNTGDLASIDEDGFVTLTGRIKELIISGGLNVYPKEAEDAIYRAPGVKECAVVGVPDERFGEVPAAVIVPVGDEFDLSVAKGICESDLSPYKRPKYYFVRDEPLPRNTNAKVLKRELAPWAAAEVAAGAIEIG